MKDKCENWESATSWDCRNCPNESACEGSRLMTDTQRTIYLIGMSIIALALGYGIASVIFS